MAETLDQSLPDTELLEHRNNTAGALMIIEFPTVTIHDLALSALNNLRALERSRYQFTHVFVLDDGELVGQVNMVDLALSRDDTPVQSIVEPVLATVTVSTSAEECAACGATTMSPSYPWWKRGAGPGLSPPSCCSAPRSRKTPARCFARRALPVRPLTARCWAHPHPASLTDTESRDDVPSRGNDRSLRVNPGAGRGAGRLPARRCRTGWDWRHPDSYPYRSGHGPGRTGGSERRRLLAREALLGLLNGVWLGVLVAAIAFIWQRNPALGLVLGVAMLGNMIIAGTVGAGVPLLLRRVGVDPAVASAIVVTTFTDVFRIPAFPGHSHRGPELADIRK